ncbi:hypothetical protein EDB80DRAFT_734436, partial [Ilyonectria destructans]
MPQVFTIPWSSPVCTLRPLPTVAYCVVEEGQTLRRARTLHRPSQADVQLPAILQPKVPLHIATRTIFVKTEREWPRRCFVCVGKVLSLAPDDAALEDP